MVPGAASSAEVQIVWIESMATMPGGGPLSQRRKDVLDAGGRAERDGGVGQLHARGAQTDLRHRFLARDVDRATARLGEGGERLQDQRRLADARIAADQQRRARHQPAAADPVELGNAGSAARRMGIGCPEVLEREGPSARAGPGAAARRRCTPLLHDRVPAAARVAAPRPFGMDGAAGLAGEGNRRSSHPRARIRRPASPIVSRTGRA